MRRLYTMWPNDKRVRILCDVLYECAILQALCDRCHIIYIIVWYEAWTGAKWPITLFKKLKTRRFVLFCIYFYCSRNEIVFFHGQSWPSIGGFSWTSCIVSSLFKCFAQDISAAYIYFKYASVTNVYTLAVICTNERMHYTCNENCRNDELRWLTSSPSALCAEYKAEEDTSAYAFKTKYD